MNITWKSWIFAAFALAALAWLGQQQSDAHSQLAADTVASSISDRTCNPHDPFAPCAPTIKGYPVGSGLSVILIEDLL